MLKRNLMLVAVLLSVAAASLTAQGRQERFVNPVISSVAPVAPTGSPTGQLLTITGSNFAPGLTLIVTTPNAKKVTYSGDAIQRQKETSFDVRVVLASEGAYTMTVSNANGDTSEPFTLKVRAAMAKPRIDSVIPEQPTKSREPQVLKVSGERFEPGLSITLTDPTGEVVVVKGAAVGALTATSFEVSVVIELAGEYGLLVTNPNGEASNNFALAVMKKF